MKGSGDYMKQGLVVKKDMLEQVYDCIDLAMCGEACKEYCLINKAVLEKGGQYENENDLF